jgi:nucleotide-binding universal stress UspA family protein
MANSAIQRLLVPVDLSSCSRAALAFATGLAEACGATIDVLFVRSPASVPSSADSAATAEELHRFVTSATPNKQISITERIDTGEAPQRIVAVAEKEGYSAIVLGTHGRTGRARSLAGSVAEAVVRTASCPVVTVREPR